MSQKSARIAAVVEQFQGQDFAPCYLAYFDCFNRQLFYEAHDVLEELWLPQREGPNGPFFKGLIQLAGAFVHLQKQRLQPAAALFKLSRSNLKQFADFHEGLDLTVVRALVDHWLSQLEKDQFSRNPLTTAAAPKLDLPVRPTRKAHPPGSIQ